MTGQGRAAYLEAMGITVWESRNVGLAVPGPANEEAGLLKVSMCSRSDSPWLWVIADQSQKDSGLFADIRRAAGDAGECNICIADPGQGTNLSAITDELLVTRVVLFDQELGADDLVRQKSCDIVEAPSLDVLAGSADMKRTLWNKLQLLLDYQRL